MARDQRTKVLYVVILLLSLAVRGLTTYFIHTHLSDPAWFQSGTYALFDRQAQDILDHRSSPFWIDDSARTDSVVYPPGFSLWIALIYKLTGQRSAASVQMIQWVLDSLSVFLIVGIGITAFGSRVGLIAGLLAALSPLLALSGAVPLADAPTSWLVLGAIWFLLTAAKTQSVKSAFAAGLMVGLSCWFRGNALLLPVFWIVALLFLRIGWRTRWLLSTAVVVGMGFIVTPLLVRNAIAFRVLTPTGLGVGTNLWEGIGETERAGEFGAVYGDENLIDQERDELGAGPDARFSLYYPDGVRRDRERTRKALAVIRAHPVWYAGVMLRRMAGVLKFAGDPQPYYGSAGINVTSRKCLPRTMQGGVVSLFVTVLGMGQSVLRYLALPLILLGIGGALKNDWRFGLLVLSTILYYLIVGSSLHTEFRYGLPMQALLLVFAGLPLSELMGRIEKVRNRSKQISR